MQSHWEEDWGRGHQMGKKPRTDNGMQKQKPREERSEKKALSKLADENLTDVN